MFDLDTAIATWRRSLRFNRSFLRTDLDELEAHLRDHVDQLLETGLTPEQAYRQALSRLGHVGSITSEYRKVRWGRSKRRAHLGQTYVWSLFMLKNYFITATRALRKRPGYLFINVFGLALGLACCLLIFLFIRDELSYDRFHTDADRLYRVAVLEDYGNNQVYFNTTSPLALAPALEDRFPEIEAGVRVATSQMMVRHGEDTFSERIHLVDPDFFEVFDFSLLEGERETVLNELKSVVLTRSAATRLFGETDPVGQTIQIEVGDEPEAFRVTGLAADVPSNTSIRFDYVMPIENGRVRWSPGAWTSFFSVIPETYIRLPEDYAGAQLADKANDVIGPMAMGEDFEPGAYTLRIQPITDIHLNPEFPIGNEPISDPQYSYILGAIALLVLFLACINFTTLALARSADRALEVGVRKVMGAERSQLIRQFSSETLLLAVLGLGVGIGLTALALPMFNTLAGKTLSLNFDAGMILAMVLLIVMVGLVAGSYPALYLSRFNPVEVLNDRLKLGRASLFRQGLTVVQFTVSIFLMIAALLMGQQLRYLQDRPLGFDQEAVVSLPTGLGFGEGLDLTERFRSEIAGHDAVASVTASLFAFGEGWMEGAYTDESGVYREFYANAVGLDFFETMDMEFVAGRPFSREIGSDAQEALIVNEAFVAEYGWDDPLNARIPGAQFPTHQIVGVVKDFNFQSLHTPVAPLVLTMDPNLVLSGVSDVMFTAAPQPKIAVRLRTADLSAALDLLETTWAEVAPGQDFAYSFLDEDLGAQYRQEQRLGAIMRYATAFALIIACLGLFGLAALLVTKRTKEIGIRKVLGASAVSVVSLLTRDFIRLVGLAFVLAVPLAYLALRHWLADFAYRIEVGPLPFLLAGLIVGGVALLTVGIQSFRAARLDPVHTLRDS